MIGFVIPAHNEALWIERSVRAIRRSAEAIGLDYDLVVVDDASEDQTAALAEAAGARVISVQNRQISATRNAGARAVRGPFLCFVDADTEVNPEVLALTLQALRHGAVGGGATFRFDDPVPPYTRHLLRAATWIFRRLRLTGGAYFFARRGPFEAVGGFDPRLFAGEELALAFELKRLGRFEIVPSSVLTSARKLRAYNGRELLSHLLRLVWRGPRALLNRDALDLWYRRRQDESPKS